MNRILESPRGLENHMDAMNILKRKNEDTSICGEGAQFDGRIKLSSSTISLTILDTFCKRLKRWRSVNGHLPCHAIHIVI